MQKKNPLIQEAITQLVKSKNYYFYGEFLLFISFIEDNTVPTIGVTIDKYNKKFKILYNENYINSLDIKNIKAILIHEVLHILNSHIKRVEINKHDNYLANLAQDMIINDLINGEKDDTVELPEGAVYIPKDYKNEKIYEVLYDWLLKEKNILNNQDNNNQSNNNTNQDNNNQSNNNTNQDNEFENKSIIESILNKKNKEKNEKNNAKKLKEILKNNIYHGLDEHLVIDDEVSDFDRENQLKEILNSLKERGLISNNIEKIINQLNVKKPTINVFKKIKRAISLINSNYLLKEKTFKKINRKIPFVIKGNKKYGYNFNVILDTSGSMSNNFEKILSYLLYAKSSFNLIQIDTEIKEFIKIKNKNELKSLKIKGLGGTELQPAINFLLEKKLNKEPLLILTDGYTDTLNLKHFLDVIIITNGINVNIKYKPKRCFTFNISNL